MPNHTEPLPTLRFHQEARIDAAPAAVWKALTDARQFGEWFGVRLDTVFSPGQLAVGKMERDGHEHLDFTAKVVRMQPERLFSFRWHPHAEDPSMSGADEPTTLVEFTLDEAQGKTLLTVAESGFERLPARRRHTAFEVNSRGWAQQLDNLQGFLLRRR
ncbi:MAG: vanillate O-demethylase oxidoreductase VanB [Rhodoferax sp.]|nr:vanillate O-demethylase oxidoreductase VanB [Rhodoferax sp.]